MGKVKTVCKECGIEFLVRKSQLKIGTGKYCSHSCAAKNQKVESLEIRFWKMVDKKEEDECWIFIGCKNKDGYGKMSKGNSKLDSTHRISYELHKGNIPENMVVMHTCDNPSCCNPKHLILGTQNDNMQDMISKRRFVPRNTPYKLTEEQMIEIRNNYIGKRGEKVKLAKEYDVVVTTITNILNNKSWKWQKCKMEL